MKIYTDGACGGNGKENAPGGAAYVIINNDSIVTSGFVHIDDATNNICELTALIEGCKKGKNLFNISDFQSTIIVYSDSAYCINCYKQKWYENWIKNGWKTANKLPVKNKELWEELIPFFNNPNFRFEKVAGHSGNRWNEYVDRLAVMAKENE